MNTHDKTDSDQGAENPAKDADLDLDADSRMIVGLLRRFGKYFAAPAPKPLSPEEIELQVNKLMAATRGIRPKTSEPSIRAAQRKPGRLLYFPAPVLALAASLLILLGISWWIRPPVGPGPGIPEEPQVAKLTPDVNTLPKAPSIGLFAMALPVMRSVVAGTEGVALFDLGIPPIAYVFDPVGPVTLARGTQGLFHVTYDCFVVQADDELSLYKDSSAVLLFKDHAVILTGPVSGRITPGGFLTLTGKTGPAIPFSDTIGGIVPPGELLAPVVKSPLPAQYANRVLSPAGATYSQTPDIVWAGDANSEYDVSVFQVVSGGNDSPVVEARAVKGYRLSWADQQWPELIRGADYRTIIRKDGVITSDPQHRFSVLNEPDAARIFERLKWVDATFQDGKAKDFMKAMVLLKADPACAAESRLRAVKLRRDSEDNIIYLKLLQRCLLVTGNHADVSLMDEYIKDVLSR